jgi:hypothetical protein
MGVKMNLNFEKYVVILKEIVFNAFLYPFRLWNNMPDYVRIAALILLIILTLIVSVLLIKLRKEHLFRGF